MCYFSGLTRQTIILVSEQVGAKWKQLCRHLEVQETTIEVIDMYPWNVLEKAYQGLLGWVREKGHEAKKDVLVKALQNVGLKNVAEKIECYQTV